MAEIDFERLLATAARRMAKLSHDDAAVALADSNVVLLRWANDHQLAIVYLEVGGDHFDALTAPEISSQTSEPDEYGDQRLVPSVLQRVFRDVLPPGQQAVDVHVAIRNDEVTEDWRSLDSAGRLVPAAKTPAADLDLSRIPTDSDLLMHLARLNRLDQEPEETIGAAKDLVEATSKLVLMTLGRPVDRKTDVSALSKTALSVLHLHPEVVAPTAKGADTIRRILAGLQQIAAGLAELRNMGYGTGHGQGRRVGGLSRRHAELAARSAAAYVGFVLATLSEPDAPWRKIATPAKRAVEGSSPMPAAANFQRQATSRSRSFRDGERVTHANWGDGIVVTSKLTYGDEEVTVAYRDPTVGRKVMLASLAPLVSLEKKPTQT